MEEVKKAKEAKKMKEVLKIENLVVEVEGKRILDGVNLLVNEGEIHVLMGKNGTGKSTLMYTIMGHPDYEIVDGKIFFMGKDITEMETYERARLRYILVISKSRRNSRYKNFGFFKIYKDKSFGRKDNSNEFCVKSC